MTFSQERTRESKDYVAQYALKLLQLHPQMHRQLYFKGFPTYELEPLEPNMEVLFKKWNCNPFHLFLFFPRGQKPITNNPDLA